MRIAAAGHIAPVLTRTILADHQAKVRSALRLLIEQEQAFQVVAEAHNADSLLNGILHTNPHIALLDWDLPGLPDMHKLELMHRIDPDLKVIALCSRPEARQASLAEGAHAFISKAEPPDNLLHALYSLRTL